MPPLTDAKIRNAKPGITPAGRPTAKPYKLGDAGGLYVEVTPAGGKLWRLKYRMGGKERRLAMGAWPGVSLKVARQSAAEARRLLAQGIDPGAERKRARTAESFAALLDRWMADASKGRKPATLEKWQFLAGHLNKHLGHLRPDEIEAAAIMRAVRGIYRQGDLRETAERAHAMAGRVFRWAVAHGLAERNPAADVALRDLLPAKTVRSRAALIDPAAVGGLLRAIEGYQGSPITRLALRFGALTFVRPGELRHAEWAEFDGDTWRIPGRKMKSGEPHLVPLSKQVLAVLEELRPLTGGDNPSLRSGAQARYLFPSERTLERPMSENTIGAALRRMGYSKDEMTGHGFRATASTLLHELGFPPMVIERQLAHAERNEVAAAYNRADLLPARVQMMQAWADYLDGLMAGGNVVALRRPAAQ